jgi:pimeloyl-ACP methyl ester carboxylesterase
MGQAEGVDAVGGRAAQSLRLPDGRELGFAEWGAVNGDLVVVDFHGGPGCRLAISADLAVVEASGVRWITVDRPGLGLSSPHPDRTVCDFARDVGCLVDHLRVEQFVALGWSMGGPYAAACAFLQPDRVRGFGLLAPAPVGLDRSGAAARMGKAWAWQLASDDPWRMADVYTRLGLEARRNPALAVELFSDGLSQSELAVMLRPEVQNEFVDMFVEATRQGAVGLVDDLRVEMQPWGFDPAAITRPGFVWQADDDSFVIAEMAHEWARTVPGLEATMLSGDGHFFPFSRTGEIIEALERFPRTRP